MAMEKEVARFGPFAQAIANGEVVGWYQGRAEWGPRALGNRSILGDPRRPDMKEILNLKIKRREPFRPFAPSILEERTGEWFTLDHPDPFMRPGKPFHKNRLEHDYELVPVHVMFRGAAVKKQRTEEHVDQ